MNRKHPWIALTCFALGLLCLSGIACLGSGGAVRTTPNAPASTLHLNPQFDAAFYREFALGNLTPVAGFVVGLQRQQVPPSFFINTHDSEGAPVPHAFLEVAAHAIATTLPLLTGGWQALISYGPMPDGLRGTVEVTWDAQADTAMGSGQACGVALVGGQTLGLFYRVEACLCDGVIAPLWVRHETGHILGFHHTQAPGLMAAVHDVTTCDQEPTAREQFHAGVAYSRPVGSIH